MTVCTINGCRVDEARIDDLRRVLATYEKEVRANEPGCLSLRVLQDAADPCAVIVYAEFADQRAYDLHLASAHVAWLRDQLRPLMGATHHKTIYRPFLE